MRLKPNWPGILAILGLIIGFTMICLAPSVDHAISAYGLVIYLASGGSLGYMIGKATQ